MQLLNRALGLLGMQAAQSSPALVPDYRTLMNDALRRVRLAELQIKEATTIEDLDIGRSGLNAAWAEVQLLVRLAKRDQGIEMRSVAESEEIHRRLLDYMNHRARGEARRRTGTEA